MIEVEEPRNQLSKISDTALGLLNTLQALNSNDSEIFSIFLVSLFYSSKYAQIERDTIVDTLDKMIACDELAQRKAIKA